MESIYNKGLDDLQMDILSVCKKICDLAAIFCMTDTDHNIIFTNNSFADSFAHPDSKLLGTPYSDSFYVSSCKKTFAEMHAALKEKKSWRGVLMRHGDDGKMVVLDTIAFAVLDSKTSEISRYAFVHFDVTEQHNKIGSLELLVKDVSEHQKAMEAMKSFDKSTGLPNQNALMDYLQDNNGRRLSVIGIKIDQFQVFKSTIGWDLANQYVVDLTVMLQRYIKESSGFLSIYRVYADEVLILFDGHNSSYKKIAIEFSQISRYFVANCDGISLTSTFTILFYEDSHDIFSKIQIKMKYAYDNFRGEIFYGNEEHYVADAKDNIFWLSKYFDAIEDELIQPYYQPMRNLKTGNIEKFECLARIKSKGEIISPDKFVPIASEIGQISFLTKAIARKSFENFANFPQYEFSLNLNASDLQDDELMKQILYWQNKMEIDPSRIVFEILESDDMYKYRLFKESLARYKKEGFKIAIDDFGTGYSNFISLYDYDVDYIKIDGSFVKNMDTDPHMVDIVNKLNGLIKMCGAQSIAEYAANDTIVEMLKEIGVDYAQGHAIGKPAEFIS